MRFSDLRSSQENNRYLRDDKKSKKNQDGVFRCSIKRRRNSLKLDQFVQRVLRMVGEGEMPHLHMTR